MVNALLSTGFIVLLLWAAFAYGRRHGSIAHANEFRPKAFNPQIQLALVETESFKKCPIFNKAERMVFYGLKDALRDAFGSKYLLFAQVCVGQFLKCEDDKAHSAINSKRVDFLVTDTRGNPVLVIEYQGRGHYRGNATVRDEVKRRAFRSAGLELYEIDALTKKEVLQHIVIDYINSIDARNSLS